VRPAIQVGLSTASVYPLRTEAAFEYAARLGYDGVELMVWAETVSQDIDAIERLSVQYQMPVLSVHAPCLLISQRVWGANPIPKLERSVRAAEQLGAQTVVVHPPFRGQRRYAESFSEQVAELEADSDVLVAVENMFPFRADRFFGAGQSSIDRMRKRGGGPGVGISAFAPSYDPLDGEHVHFTLDLSHTATASTRTSPSTCRIRRRRAPTRWRWPIGWVPAWCICTCATATDLLPTSTWCRGAAPSRPLRCASCSLGAISPAM
jgi:sugar phosphate isomerase/epimerase